MKLGIDRIFEEGRDRLKGKRIAILAHRASLNSTGRHVLELTASEGLNVCSIFGPEHGFDTKAQDMEAVSSRRTTSNEQPAINQIPVYSLYGQTFDSLKPTKEMFGNIDVLIVDLQDIGSRYYTYIYTMALCMKTAAKTDTKVIVCDRPNPINGIDVEGGLIESGYESFVGLYPLPNRHGLTIGELANYFNIEYEIGCDLEIIKIVEWKRGAYLDETKVTWANPSPNMRSLNAAILYPGMCLIEGTNLSEGRGTETPFENVGAPFIDGKDLLTRLKDLKLPGIDFYRATFTPAFQKWTGEKCHGIRFEIINRKMFKPYLTGLALVWLSSKYNGFKWRTEKYEFRSDVPAIDLLTGSNKFRTAVDSGSTFERLQEFTKTPQQFLTLRQKYLFY